jgi:hypothetical protein
MQQIDFAAIVKNMSTAIDSAKNSASGYVVIKNDTGEFRVYAEKRNTIEKDVTISIKDGVSITFKDEDEEERKHSANTDLYLGLNNFLEDGKIPNGTPYSLRPLGARYFEIAFRNQTRMFGEKSPLYLSYAVSFSWYNFMFNGNNRLVVDGGAPQFVLDTEHTLAKTKLTSAYVNVPLMLKFKKKNFSLAAGGYVGYRLGSHTKVKYRDASGEWEKDKNGDAFGLSNVRYGLRAELNWVGPTLFASYDMNTLFDEGSNMPKLNAFTFGIKL